MADTQQPRQGFVAGLISRWFGDLRPVGVSARRRALAASVLVLLVGVAIFAASVYSPGLAPANDTLIASPATAEVETLPISAEDRSMDELIRCHQNYQISQPLGPDAGMMAALNLQD